jgi:tRNA modification GTPase
MVSPLDTIVAPITGVGAAAVAGIRVSGPDAWKVAAAVFPAWPAEVEPLKATYGRFAHGDDGYALPFQERRSFTGDQSVEFFVHGSPESVRQLIQLCLDAGARYAEPGEFTLRAFLNGRIDLTQAEAVRDTVEAQTDAQLRAANALREGALRDQVRSLRDRAIGLLAAVEASVDFSDEIGELDRSVAQHTLRGIREALEGLLSLASSGLILRRGLRIAIVGPPNAGKSSLLNAILKSERAIVTDVPGTTRDTVEEAADFSGFPVVLIDTAGLRESQDPVESIGIQRSRAAAANADRIWYVYDASLGWSPDDQAAVSAFERPVEILANKTDLGQATPVGLAVSALTGQGLPHLVQTTVISLESTSPTPYINGRHEGPLRSALEAVETLGSFLAHDAPEDLLATLLRQLIHDLGQVTGETVEADMLQRIFQDFCVGK